jgi:hypothetical protein
VDLASRHLLAKRRERVLDPVDGSAFAKWQLVRIERARLEREAELGSQLWLVLDHLLRESLDHQLETLRRIRRRAIVEQRSATDLWIDRDQQRALVWEVAIRGSARDRSPVGGLLHGGADALGEQLAHGRQQRRPRARLLARPACRFIWD